MMDAHLTCLPWPAARNGPVGKARRKSFLMATNHATVMNSNY